jgi:hypothetical protein
MKKFVVLMLAAICLLSAKTIIGESPYTFGESETIIQAKNTCKQLAIRNAVEKFATYIESETVVRDMAMEKDVIVGRSQALVKDVEVLEEKLDLANMSVYYKIKGEIDEKEVIEALKKRGSESGIDGIKKSGEYYFGEGSDKNARKADDDAIENLIRHIAQDMLTDFSDINGEEELLEFTLANISTYKSNFSNNCKKKVEAEKVLRYINRNDMKEIFSGRMKKINDYADMAIEKEGSAEIGSALKYYYWALSLLRSHPEHNRVKSDKFGGRLMMLSLNDKINSILNGITIDVTNVKEEVGGKTVFFLALYKGVEIQDLHFKYLNGSDQSMLQPVRNGRGSCEFSKNAAENLKTIRFDIEYRYELQSGLDKELQRVIEGVTGQYFPASRITVDTEAQPPKVEPAPAPKIQVQNYTPAKEQKSGGPVITAASPKSYEQINLSENEISKCTSVVCEIVKAIEKKNFTGIEQYFTVDGLKTFERVIKYGKAELQTNTFDLKAGAINDEIVVRSIPMKFTFGNNKQATVEDVIFTFSKDIKIDHLSFGLSKIAIKDIMSKDERFATPAEKLQIIQFMEYYKTAYSLKQLDYINNIFAENALIIVGKILNEDPKPIGDMYNKLGEEKVRYNRLKKGEYMEQLKMVFKSNEYINIQFEDNDVRKVGGQDRVYGIQIKQNYYSTNYADEGYLFLMMDLNDPKKPRIYVRSWQPEKNPDGSIIGLNDFTF